MKKYNFYIIVFMMILLCPISVKAVDVEYDQTIRIVQEMMKAYYNRGPYLQYNYAKTQYGNPAQVTNQNEGIAPEHATSQDNNYLVCAAFTYAVYNEGFGITGNTEFMSGDNTFKDNSFPRYNYHIIQAAQSEYKKIVAGKSTDDGHLLLYYQSNTDQPITPSKEDGYNRDREIVRYVHGDKDVDTTDDDLETLINNVQPGDILAYTGHALIVYDVVDRNGDGEIDDALILNSTGKGEIRTQIEGTSTIYYNIVQRTNGILDVAQEGGIRFLWLSESPHFVNQTTGKLRCHSEKAECAIIRPFYNNNGNAQFNFKKEVNIDNYYKNSVRVNYPGIKIEKTEKNRGDNNSIYVGDTLTYSIKITNTNSEIYTGFTVEDQLRVYRWVDQINKKGEKTGNKIKEYCDWNDTELCGWKNIDNLSLKDNISVQINSISHDGTYDPDTGKIVWEIGNYSYALSAGDTITLSYNVKLEDNIDLVGIYLESSGQLKSGTGDGITTGVVDNKIIPKVTKLKKSYSDCYQEIISNSEIMNNPARNSGLNLIDEIYICATGKDFGFSDFSSEMFKTSGTTKVNGVFDFDYSYSNTTKFKNMILNNYVSALVEVEKEDGMEYYLPRWREGNNNDRAKTINASDFKDGDILVYGGRQSDEYVNELYGSYAYIYINGEFKGINYSKDEDWKNFARDRFTYDYYENIPYVGETACTLGNEIACSYWGNLYGGYPKLTSTNKDEILTFANYQTLFGKDYYIVLRPEQVMEEIVEVKLTAPSTTQYIQNYEELNLDGGSLEVSYNYGEREILDLTATGVKVTGFNNKIVGKNTVTVEYEGYKNTFVVDIVSRQATKIEIVQKPTKTQYVQNSEQLDLTGGIIKVTFNDTSIDEISMTNDEINITGFNNESIGLNTVTVEYQGHTATFNVDIIAKTVAKIEINKKPIKTNYIQNQEQLDLTGGVIKATFNDNRISQIPMTNSNVQVSGFDNSKPGKNSITVEYQGKTATFDVTIIEKQIEKIEVTTLPTKTQYVQNSEELDLTGGIITATYNDGTQSSINMKNADVKATGFDNGEVKTITINITYQGRSTTFTVEIIAKEVTKIEVTTLPTKTQYVQNSEELDLTGGIITVTYNDQSTGQVDMTNSNVQVSGFNNSVLETKTLTVSYQGCSTTFIVEIIAKQVTKIEATTPPTKTQYVQNSEELDLTGGVITVTYNDGTINAISMTNDEVTATGFSNKTVGNKIVTLEYLGHTTTITVEIISKQIVGIEIKDAPYKTKYVQNSEDLDLTGGIITLIYNDKSTDEISMINESVKVSGFDNNILGKQTITVEYLGYQETFDVEIISKQIVKVEVTQMPTEPKLYSDQGQLELTGGVITVTYNDGTTNTVSMTSDDIKLVSFDKKQMGKQTIILSYLGHSFTLEVEVVEGVENPSTGDFGSMGIAILLTLIISLFAYRKIKNDIL